MKNFIFAIGFALILSSCGTKTSPTENTTTDSTAVKVDTCFDDSVSIDSTKAQINMNDIKV
jgi:hypothetical protein